MRIGYNTKNIRTERKNFSADLTLFKNSRESLDTLDVLFIKKI